MFVPEIVPLWIRKWNQGGHTDGLMRGGGGLIHTWSNTSVVEKVGLSVGSPCTKGLIGEEIRY